jgi:pimeloyl-ACP methyl ester carboxylesterase
VTGPVRYTPERLVRANGLTLCYDAFGEEEQPPVVLIMGMGAQMIGWDDEFCRQLAAQGLFVVRFDNRDAGRSTRFDHAGTPDVMAAMTRAWLGIPVQAPYLLQDMALDVVGLLDALDIRRAHLVGASMGGTIAQTVALRHPERMLSLTSIMSTTGDRDLPHPKPWALSALMKPTPAALDDYVEHYVRTWRMLRGDRFPEEDERDRARAVRNYARGLNPAGGARQLAAILASGSRRQALRRVSSPTLVIHGDADPLVPLAAGRDTAASIPGAELLVLPGMGHALPKQLWPRIVDGIVDIARAAA